MYDQNNSVSNGINKLSLFEVNIVAENVGKAVKVSLDNERSFYGTLEAYDDIFLILRGNNGKPIMIKRRKISSLAVV